MSDFAYPVADWNAALESAELYEFDAVDAREKHGPLAGWLCDEAISHDKVASNAEIIEAAILALVGPDRDPETIAFSPDRLLTVLNSYRGSTVDDFEVLAREYAAEDYIGPDNPEDTNWKGFSKEADYEAWFARYGQSETEVCTSVSTDGTLYWFDSAGW